MIFFGVTAEMGLNWRETNTNQYNTTNDTHTGNGRNDTSELITAYTYKDVYECIGQGCGYNTEMAWDHAMDGDGVGAEPIETKPYLREPLFVNGQFEDIGLHSYYNDPQHEQIYGENENVLPTVYMEDYHSGVVWATTHGLGNKSDPDNFGWSNNGARWKVGKEAGWMVQDAVDAFLANDDALIGQANTKLFDWGITPLESVTLEQSASGHNVYKMQLPNVITPWRVPKDTLGATKAADCFKSGFSFDNKACSAYLDAFYSQPKYASDCQSVKAEWTKSVSALSRPQVIDGAILGPQSRSNAPRTGCTRINGDPNSFVCYLDAAPLTIEGKTVIAEKSDILLPFLNYGKRQFNATTGTDCFLESINFKVPNGIDKFYNGCYKMQPGILYTPECGGNAKTCPIDTTVDAGQFYRNNEDRNVEPWASFLPMMENWFSKNVLPLVNSTGTVLLQGQTPDYYFDKYLHFLSNTTEVEWCASITYMAWITGKEQYYKPEDDYAKFMVDAWAGWYKLGISKQAIELIAVGCIPVAVYAGPLYVPAYVFGAILFEMNRNDHMFSIANGYRYIKKWFTYFNDYVHDVFTRVDAEAIRLQKIFTRIFWYGGIAAIGLAGTAFVAFETYNNFGVAASEPIGVEVGIGLGITLLAELVYFVASGDLMEVIDDGLDQARTNIKQGICDALQIC